MQFRYDERNVVYETGIAIKGDSPKQLNFSGVAVCDCYAVFCRSTPAT